MGVELNADDVFEIYRKLTAAESVEGKGSTFRFTLPVAS